MSSLCDRVKSAITACEELEDDQVTHLTSCQTCSDFEQQAIDDIVGQWIDQLPETSEEAKAVANFRADLPGFIARTAACDQPSADPNSDIVDLSAWRPQWARRLLRPKVLAATAIPVVVTAGIMLVMMSSSSSDEARIRARVALEQSLAPQRSVLARMTYLGADGHRPYNARRSGSARVLETIPHAVLSQLEELDEKRGYAAAVLLRGNTDLAEQILQQALKEAGPSPDVWSDLAAVKLSRGTRQKTEEALILLDKALDAAPQHRQALWNRALALRELGRTQAAIDAFVQLVRLGEPGWSEEAWAMVEDLRAGVGQ